jgi:transposase
VYYCCRDRASEKNNIVLYDYHNSRTAQCAIDVLDGYQGYLHVDADKAYGLTQAKLVAGLVHIRRKFVNTKKIEAKSRTGKVDVALNLIGKN